MTTRAPIQKIFATPMSMELKLKHQCQIEDLAVQKLRALIDKKVRVARNNRQAYADLRAATKECWE